MEDNVGGFLLLTSLYRPLAYRDIRNGVWEELHQIKTDKCDVDKRCRAGCPTCKVKIQRLRHSSKGEFRDSQKPCLH